MTKVRWSLFVGALKVLWLIGVLNRRYYLWAYWKVHYEAKSIKPIDTWHTDARLKSWQFKANEAALALYEHEKDALTNRYTKLSQWLFDPIIPGLVEGGIYTRLSGYDLRSVGELK